MSNSHLLLKLPPCFITWLPNQGACFFSVLISFLEWFLKLLLPGKGPCSPSVLRVAAGPAPPAILSCQAILKYTSSLGSALTAASTNILDDSHISDMSLHPPFFFGIRTDWMESLPANSNLLSLLFAAGQVQ